MHSPFTLRSAHRSEPLLRPVTRPCPPCRYAILAANVLPKGFVDARAATEKLMDAIKLDEGEYRLGFTKVRHFRVPPYSSQSPTCPSCVSLAPVSPLDGPSHAFLSDFLRIFEIA